MRHRLPAAFRAGDEIQAVILLLCGRCRLAANKPRPLGPSAGVAQHGGCPWFAAGPSQSAQWQEQPIRAISQSVPCRPAKKSFCKDQIAIIAIERSVASPKPGCPDVPMDSILVKVFATALTLSQVTTHPDSVKTQFDPVKDQDEVVQLLRDGCAHMRQAFDIESINLDDLISTAMDDPKTLGADIKALHGLNFADLNTAYHQFCKNEKIDTPVVDLGDVIKFYDQAVADLPDPARLKGKQLPGMSTVTDGAGDHYADVFEPRNRRVWVSLADVPDYVQKAFIAAEDRRFYQHHGVDERGIIRAFIGNLAEPGRPQGGSTITQQVV